MLNKNIVSVENIERKKEDIRVLLAVAEARLAMAEEQGYQDYAYKYRGEVINYKGQIEELNRKIESLGFVPKN